MDLHSPEHPVTTPFMASVLYQGAMMPLALLLELLKIKFETGPFGDGTVELNPN